MDRFSTMTVFLRVVETGSFTKAADSLAMSRATVSMAVQQLEEHVGARLLHRTTRHVSLTHEGARYREHARDVLERLAVADQLFQERQPRVTGRLSIDVPTRIARRVLIPALPELLSRHPGLEIHLGASDRAINLIEQGVDAVVRVGARSDASHVARHLGSLTQVNCASPSYLARHGRPTSLESLTTHLAVAYAPGAAGATWDYLEAGFERSCPIRSVVAVDNAETYIAAGLAGLGLIQVPAYDVRHHLDSGALVDVLPELQAPPLPIALVYPSRRHLPRRLQVFASWAVTLFERHGMFDPIVR